MPDCIRIAPSILAADPLRMAEGVDKIICSGADEIHVDIMDGHFVPNMSNGPALVKALRRAYPQAWLDVHLMVDRPLRYVERFCDTGADLVSVHVEADTEENIREALCRIRAKGIRTGLVLKPKTPAEAALPFLELCDLVLVMTVEPGFGGQSFMAEMLEKIRTLRAWIDARGLDCALEVDGGIDADTAPLCIEAGATVLVAGSAVFGKGDRAAAIAAIRGDR